MCKRLGAPLLAALVGLWAVQTARSSPLRGGQLRLLPRAERCDAQSCFPEAQRGGRPGYKLVYDTVLEKRWTPATRPCRRPS